MPLLSTLRGLHVVCPGEIPSELGDLDNLTSLNLEENQLSGKIPAELGSLSNLIYLSLSSYKLSGEIPAELGNLSNLTELYLDDNDFTSSETGGATARRASHPSAPGMNIPAG